MHDPIAKDEAAEKIKSNLLRLESSKERLQKYKFTRIDPRSRKSLVYNFLPCAKYDTVGFMDKLHTPELNKQLN